MKIACISPVGFKSPMLFDSFGWMQTQGHSFVDVGEADVAFFDSHSGFAPYHPDEIHSIIKRNMPLCWFDAFDQLGSPNHRCEFHGFDEWRELRKNKKYQNEHWAICLRMFLDSGLLRLYFLRKMQKSFSYASVVRPLELIQYPDHDFPLAPYEDYAERPFDFCFIGASSPWRANLVCDLVRAGFKVDYFFPHIRIPHHEWLNRHRQAKFFIEADGGGFGSERPYQLMTIAPMLKANNDQLIVNDFVHEENCLKVGDVWGRPSVQEIAELRRVLNDLERCYQIYARGAAHLKQHFSAEARSRYILGCMSETGVQ